VLLHGEESNNVLVVRVPEQHVNPHRVVSNNQHITKIIFCQYLNISIFPLHRRAGNIRYAF
jgi:hypothetical protein